MKQRRPKSIRQLVKEILDELHDIDQKVDHLIRRLPKSSPHPRDPQWNHFFG
jgi:hypothetical protein